MGYRRNTSNIGKTICDKITANITLNGEKVEGFLTTLEGARCPYQRFSFTIELKSSPDPLDNKKK